MSIIDAAEWDAAYDIVKAAAAWRKARATAISDITHATFEDLAKAEAKLVQAVDYCEKHYGIS